jgi:hypothetical protein
MRWQDILAIGAVGVAVLFLWKLLSRPAASPTTVNAPQTNPWVALIDKTPSIIGAAEHWFTSSDSSASDLGGETSPVDPNPSGVSYGL